MKITPINLINSNFKIARNNNAIYNPIYFSFGRKKAQKKDTVEISQGTIQQKTKKLTQKDVNKMPPDKFRLYIDTVSKRCEEIPELKDSKDIDIDWQNVLLLDRISANKKLYTCKDLGENIYDICTQTNTEETDYKVALIDKFLSNERLYNNLSLREHMIGIIMSTNTEDKSKSRIQILDKYLSDEKYYNNPLMIKNIGRIINCVQDAEDAKAKIKVIDRFLADKKRYKNPQSKEPMLQVIFSVSDEREIEFKIKIIDKYLSDKKLYENPFVSTRITDIIWDVDSDIRFDIANMFLSNPDLYNNEVIGEQICDLIYSSQDIYCSDADRGSLIKKFLSEPKLYGNDTISTYMSALVDYIDNINQVKLVDKILSDENLYNNKALLSAMWGYYGLLNSIETSYQFEVAQKALSAPETFFEDWGDNIKWIINSTTCEEDADIKLALMDRLIANFDMFDSKEALQTAFNALCLANINECYQYMNIDNQTICNTPFKDKLRILNMLCFLRKTNLFSDKENKKIDGAKKRIEESFLQTIKPTKVTKEQRIAMFQGFFANNNPTLVETLQNADFTQYGKKGLPLKYSRKEFLSDLNSILSNISDEEKNEILSKLNINIIKDSLGQIIGYDGIIDLEQLSDKGIEGRVLNLANKFIKENYIETGDKDLDKALNSLIQGMGEFINIIGKPQHKTQEYSLDIHILKVLQQALKNPNYKQLPNLDKTCLKLAIIMHDIAKSQGVIDKVHPYMSALYSRNILEKYPLPIFIKDRIFELIKNHHWLSDYDKNRKDSQEISALFRRKSDFTLAKIMAEADLKGVSESFYNIHSAALNPKYLEPVEKSLARINSKGQLVFTTKVIQKEKIPTVNYNGKEYRVINFTQIKEGTDLGEYGFVKGTKKDDVRLYIHMAETSQNLETVNTLTDIANTGFLSASYVSLNNCHTYRNLRFGISLECENVNIANVSKGNQTSGGKKDFNNFINCITEKDSSLSLHRSLIPEKIMQILNLSKDEYSKLYEQLAQKQYITQIRKEDIYKIGTKDLKGEDILKAVINAQDSILSGRQNESNLYNPKINAFVARVDKIEEIPDDMLDFAYKHNLPIYLLGK